MCKFMQFSLYHVLPFPSEVNEKRMKDKKGYSEMGHTKVVQPMTSTNIVMNQAYTVLLAVKIVMFIRKMREFINCELHKAQSSPSVCVKL